MLVPNRAVRPERRIDAISSATYTSAAYLSSLQRLWTSCTPGEEAANLHHLAVTLN